MNGELLYRNEVYAIQGAVYDVYSEMGNGYREGVYQQCLERELDLRGVPYESKRELKIFYKGVAIEKTYIPDLFCYDKIIVELKACACLTNEHLGQIDNYLRMTRCRLGLLVNFGAYPKVAIRRWVR